jgi:hypothetical protein
MAKLCGADVEFPMKEREIEELKETVERMHDCRARLREVVPVLRHSRASGFGKA